MYDLIVIGGGPAAMSALFYATGKQLHVMMIYEDLGGKIGWLQSLAGPTQQQYLPGNELMQTLTMRALSRDDQILNDRVCHVTKPGTYFSVETAENGTLEAATVLVATGATPLPLHVPGAQHFADRGLGYSVTTYAHLLAGKRVAVIGGTPRALSGVAEAANTAERVFLISPTAVDLSHPLGRALVGRSNVELLEGYEVVEIRGQRVVESVIVERDGVRSSLAVDRVFVALGLVPNSEIVRDLAATDPRGYILVNAYHETTLPGLFAAGDVSSTFSEQVLIAIGDGARAAMSAYDYVLAQRLFPDAQEASDGA
ncbi:MAG TPA: NAD(P)/FAD-dependent oxidoreductase [Herpetosiphonaceae bacterium]